MGVEDQADGIGLAADRERMDLELWPAGRDRLADLEHVRAEDHVTCAIEVVGVVLHERHAAGQTGAHDLHRPNHGGRLPVALGAEAVPVAHQSLDGQTRQLGQAVQILERRREGAEAAVGQEASQPELDPGAIAQGLGAVAARPEGRHDIVFVEIGGDELVDLDRVRPRRPRRRGRRRHSR